MIKLQIYHLKFDLFQDCQAEFIEAGFDRLAFAEAATCRQAQPDNYSYLYHSIVIIYKHGIILS